MILRKKVNYGSYHLSLPLLAFMFFIFLGLFQFSLDASYAYPDMGSNCASCHDGSTAPVLDDSQGASQGTEGSKGAEQSTESSQGKTESSINAPQEGNASDKPQALDNSRCLSCHEDDIDLAKFEASAHGKLSCVSCHKNAETFPHKPLDPQEKITTKADLNEKCASCHQGYVVESYNRSFHGIAVTNGYEDAAGCTDCHGDVHNILPASDPNSPIAAANLAKTCDSCHPGMAAAGANIVKGKEHVVPEDKVNAFPLWITWKIFLALILFDIVMNGTIPTLELLKMLRNLSRPLTKTSGKDVSV